MMIRSHKPAGFALLLAAAAMVALMAVVFSFSPPGVGAHGCATIDSATDVHKNPAGVDCDSTTPAHGTATNHAALSSTTPGQDVAIRLTTTAGADIATSNIITVDFSPWLNFRVLRTKHFSG